MTPRRPRRRWLAVLAGLLLAPPVAEVGHRVVLAARGAPYDADGTRQWLVKVRASIDNLIPVLDGGDTEDGVLRSESKVPHPYTGYDKTEGFLLVEAELEAVRDGTAAASFDVLILGGSVAQMFCAYGSERLRARLEEDPRLAGRAVRTLCFGRGGFKEPQQVMTLAWLLALGIEPDAVINLDGFNEVALGNDNAARHGAHPVYPSIGHWSEVVRSGGGDPDALALAARALDERRAIARSADRALAWGLWRSSLIGRGLAESIQRRRAAAGELQREYERGLVVRNERLTRGPALGADADAVAVAVASWARCSRSLSDLCRGRGIAYLHVLQPTLHDPGSKPWSDEERRRAAIAPTWKEGVLRGYPLLRAAGAELAAAGVAFFDATGLFRDVERTLYIDPCHLGQEGNDLLADAVAEAFLDAWTTE